MIVGIDNGVTGGIVILSDTGAIIAQTKMPIKSARKGDEVDVIALHKWLVLNTEDNLEKCFYVIEEPAGARSANAVRSMSASFHAVRGFLETKRLRWERITAQSWQKKMLPGCKAGQTKPRALARSSELWPDETFIQKGCRVPHDGVVDAALISEYARRELL